MGIYFRHKGNFKNTRDFLKHATESDFRFVLQKYAEEGVEALSSATPWRTGETAQSWSYEIVQERDSFRIYWTNQNFNKGVNIALILQYGHGTGTGGYVTGIDYINPTMKPIFDKLAQAAWDEVKRW